MGDADTWLAAVKSYIIDWAVSCYPHRRGSPQEDEAACVGGRVYAFVAAGRAALTQQKDGE